MADFKEIQIGEDGQVYQVKDETARESQGGYTPPQGGIPKADLASDVQTSLGKADTAYQKPASGIPASDLATGVIPDISGKADKSEMSVVPGTGSNADKTTITLKQGTSATVLTQHQDVSNLATKTEVNAKANAADMPTKVSDLDNDAGYLDSEDFKTINNQSIVGSGNISIPKGDKGDTGNCTITDAGQMVSEIVNDLTTGGAEKFLSAEMGKRLKAKINEVYATLQSVYSMLAGIAFTDGKSPATLPDLDWTIPKHGVVLNLNCPDAVVKQGNITRYNGDVINVEEGETIVLTLESRSGLPMTITSSAADAVVGNSVYLTMGSAPVTLDITATSGVTVKKITAGAVVTQQGTTVATDYTEMVMSADANTGCGLVGELSQGGYEGDVVAASGYGIYSVKVTVGSTDVTDTAYNPVTKELTIGTVNGDIAVEIVVMPTINGMFDGVSFFGQSKATPSSSATSEHRGALVQDADWCATPDFIAVPTGTTEIKYVHQANYPSRVTDPWPWVRRCLMAYTDTGLMTPDSHATIYEAGQTERDLTSLAGVQLSDIKYVRASFPKSALSSCKIQFVVNGNTVDGWVGTQPHIPTNS